MLIKSCKFVRNPSRIQGGAVYAATTTIVFDEGNTFEENTSGTAGAILTYQSNATFRGENNFTNNLALVDSGGLVLLMSNATISGQAIFRDNRGFTGGAIHCVLSSLVMVGNTTFIANKAEGTYGGAIHFSNGTLIISGQASFIKNGAITSGSALYIIHSNVTISGNVSISDGLSSKPGYASLLEGAIGLLNTTMILSDTGHLLLTNNTAYEGGATRLDYPDHVTRVVWLYDGNVPYFQGIDHIVLGVFALIVLFILFLPYTFLLLCGHWLLHFSASPVFTWLNRIKPFMDAYYAPYNKGTRYWTGVTLLVRCILFLIFAFNALGNASINLLAITSVMAGLAGLAWMQNRLYEHLYNDILEASFVLNLCIFSVATYHVRRSGGVRVVLLTRPLELPLLFLWALYFSMSIYAYARLLCGRRYSNQKLGMSTYAYARLLCGRRYPNQKLGLAGKEMMMMMRIMVKMVFCQCKILK